MKSPPLAVIDYGVGNLLSVHRAFEHCGTDGLVTPDPDEILRADRVVLPGVGAFGDAMRELRNRGLADVVVEVAKRGTPLLGICLGMEMLLDESEEFGRHKGLGLIPGKAVPVPGKSAEGLNLKIPHIGWSSLSNTSNTREWTGTVLDGVSEGSAVYFVHSFMAEPTSADDRIADVLYGGNRVAAVIGRDNVTGCQFHPEKSGLVGLAILRNFLQL